jgi:hypothetical protein
VSNIEVVRTIMPASPSNIHGFVTVVWKAHLEAPASDRPTIEIDRRGNRINTVIAFAQALQTLVPLDNEQAPHNDSWGLHHRWRRSNPG